VHGTPSVRIQRLSLPSGPTQFRRECSRTGTLQRSLRKCNKLHPAVEHAYSYAVFPIYRSEKRETQSDKKAHIPLHAPKPLAFYLQLPAERDAWGAVALAVPYLVLRTLTFPSPSTSFPLPSFSHFHSEIFLFLLLGVWALLCLSVASCPSCR
jgi:hypothetical protein